MKVISFTRPQVVPLLSIKEDILKNVGNETVAVLCLVEKKWYGSQWRPETIVTFLKKKFKYVITWMPRY